MPGATEEDVMTVKDGLSKGQAAILSEELNGVKELYHKNNTSLILIEKQLTHILSQRGIIYKDKRKDHDNTPRFE